MTYEDDNAKSEPVKGYEGGMSMLRMENGGMGGTDDEYMSVIKWVGSEKEGGDWDG